MFFQQEMLAATFVAKYPRIFASERPNGRRAFLEKPFPPIWADTEWIFGYLAEGGGHFLLFNQLRICYHTECRKNRFLNIYFSFTLQR